MASDNGYNGEEKAQIQAAIERRKAEDDAFRRESPLEWLQQQDGFSQLGITGVRQIGTKGAVYELLTEEFGPVELGTAAQLNSWLIPQAQIRAQAFVQLPDTYAKKTMWVKIAEAIALAVKQSGGPLSSGADGTDAMMGALQVFVPSHSNGHRYDLSNTEDKLSLIRAMKTSYGPMEDALCFVTLDSEILLQARALVNWLKHHYGMPDATAPKIGQELRRLEFKTDPDFILQARNPETSKPENVKCFISPKGFYEVL